MQEHTSDTVRESYSVTEKKEKLKSYLNDMRERERERERERFAFPTYCAILGLLGGDETGTPQCERDISASQTPWTRLLLF
jgi:hypothetical protein